MVAKNYEENMQRTVDEFTERRNQISDEIVKIRDVAKRMLDEIFNNLFEKLQDESCKIDEAIDERILDIKKSLNALKEIESYLERARSVFSMTADASYVRAF